MVANRLISSLLGVPLHDYGCTLKAYRREVIEDVRLYGEMHRFIPIYAAWEGARVTELPVTHHPRLHGKSKYGFSRISRVFLDLVILYFIDRAFDRPMQFFGKLGLAFWGLAFLTLGWAVVLWRDLDPDAAAAARCHDRTFRGIVHPARAHRRSPHPDLFRDARKTALQDRKSVAAFCRCATYSGDEKVVG
jgi:hypothetical protein